MTKKLFFTIFILILSLFKIDHFKVLSNTKNKSIKLFNAQIKNNLPQIQNFISHYSPLHIIMQELEINSLSLYQNNQNNILQFNTDFKFLFSSKIKTKLVNFQLSYTNLITIKKLQIHFKFENCKCTILGFELDGDFGFEGSKEIVQFLLNKLIGMEFEAGNSF